MTVRDLTVSDLYRNYLDCLNRRDWDSLDAFVDQNVSRNGRAIGLAAYRDMLEQDVHDIPDLRFELEMIVADHAMVASRLRFDCRPKHTFLGLSINGKRVVFTENVFYTFREGKIVEVYSVIDKAAIEAQL